MRFRFLIRCGFLGVLAGCAATETPDKPASETHTVATTGKAPAAKTVPQLPATPSEKTTAPAAVMRPQQTADEAPAVDVSHRYQYKVRGKRYKVFKHADNFQEIGMASWYGPGFHGKKTANGEIYDMHAMTAAHKALPLGTKVRVTNLENGKKIIVRINDRGPFHGGRIIDLSKTAARRLGVLKQGFAKVHVRIVE